MIRFFLSFSVVALLLGCAKGGAVSQDPLETPSVPIAGQGGDPLYYRLQATLLSLRKVADLLNSNALSSAQICVTTPQIAADKSTAAMLDALTDTQRATCRRTFVEGAAALALFSSLAPSELFREATVPLYVSNGRGGMMRVSAVTELGPAGPVLLDRSLINQIDDVQLRVLILHELMGHKIKYPLTGEYVGDNTPVINFPLPQPGRRWGDTLAAGGQAIFESYVTLSGALDPTFAATGSVLEAYDSNFDSYLTATCLKDGDGYKVFAGGYKNVSSVAEGIGAIYKLDGSLDTSFSGGRWTTTSGWVKGVARRANGTFLIGTAMADSSRTVYTSKVFALRPNGTPDTAFNNGVPVNLSAIATNFVVDGIQLLDDDSLVVWGKRVTGNFSDSLKTDEAFILVRLAADGTTMKIAGKDFFLGTKFTVADPINNAGAAVNIRHSVVVQKTSVDDDGTSHYAAHMLFWTVNNFIVRKMDLDSGLPDPTFAGGSDKSLPAALRPALVPTTRLVIQSDGTILGAVNRAMQPTGSTPALFRLLPNGELDTRFAGDGILALPLPSEGNGSAMMGGLVVDGKGRIYFSVLNVGASFEPTTIVRLNPSGTRDGTFGALGLARISFGTLKQNVNDLCLQGDKIIGVGYSAPTIATGPAMILRINP